MVMTMKVVRDTPELFLLRHRPWIAPIFCWILMASEIGVVFANSSELTAYQWVIVVGMAIGCAFGGVVTAVGTTMRFDAADQSLQWIRSSPFPYGRESVRISFKAIRSVGVEELPSSADGGPSWRVVVRTQSKVLPLTTHFSNAGDYRGIADKIDVWLRTAGVALS